MSTGEEGRSAMNDKLHQWLDASARHEAKSLPRRRFVQGLSGLALGTLAHPRTELVEAVKSCAGGCKGKGKKRHRHGGNKRNCRQVCKPR
jgi:hypothetical protein